MQSASGQALFWGVLPAWLGLAWLGLAWLGVPGRKTKAILAWLKYLGLSFLKRLHLLWSSISQAQLAVVPGCAHAVHLEKPDLFNSLLRDFLGNNASRGA